MESRHVDDRKQQLHPASCHSAGVPHATALELRRYHAYARAHHLTHAKFKSNRYSAGMMSMVPDHPNR